MVANNKVSGNEASGSNHLAGNRKQGAGLKDVPQQLNISETNENLTIRGKRFSINFSKKRGSITSIEVNNKALLAGTKNDSLPEMESGIPSFFRAPTDNDKGFGNWLAKDWQRVGLDKPVVSVEKFLSTSTSESINIEIHFRHRYGDSQTGEVRSMDHNKVNSAVRYEVKSAVHNEVLSVVRYQVFPEGYMHVKASFSTKGQLPDLPRVGLKWMVAKELQQLGWYGLGQHDSYSDRKASTNKGFWRSFVEEQYTPWPRPQHSGNKEEVSWIGFSAATAKRITTNVNSGSLYAQQKGPVIVEDYQLTFESPISPISFSATPYTEEELASKTHHHLLQESGATVLYINSFMMGLGNSSCGPGVLQEHTLSRFSSSDVIQDRVMQRLTSSEELQQGALQYLTTSEELQINALSRFLPTLEFCVQWKEK